jgi:hypothetical protein
VQDRSRVPFFGTAGLFPLFAVDIARPLFDYSFRWPSAPVVPLTGGGTIVLGLFLIVDPFLFLWCICRRGALLRRPLGVIPPDMVPLPALVPAAAIIPLAAALPGLRGLLGLRGPGCRCLRLLKFVCHIVQTD